MRHLTLFLVTFDLLFIGLFLVAVAIDTILNRIDTYMHRNDPVPTLTELKNDPTSPLYLAPHSRLRGAYYCTSCPYPHDPAFKCGEKK